METNVDDERLHFVEDFASGHWSMTELCERYDVTRPTGYKWVARHRAAATAAFWSEAGRPIRALTERARRSKRSWWRRGWSTAGAGGVYSALAQPYRQPELVPRRRRFTEVAARSLDNEENAYSGVSLRWARSRRKVVL